MTQGLVESIHLCTKRGAVPVEVDRVNAIAGRGLEGDRYFGRIKRGQPRPQDAATLIEAETIESLEDAGILLEPGETRRNITTRGVDLNALVGQTFRIGQAVFKGYELCDPCFHLEKRTGKKIKEALENQGGLRAWIVESGSIARGDAIEFELS